MRVAPCGNLTVDLIRQLRFSPEQIARHLTHDALHPAKACPDDTSTHAHHTHLAPAHHRCRVDRVELGRETLESDPWASSPTRAPLSDAHRASDDTQAKLASPPTYTPEPARLTPVVGSPALAGLGVALVVPGTLLDVVA